MPKKKRSIPEDDFDEEPFFLGDELNTFDDESAWTEEDVLDICGEANAAQGLALYQKGDVSQRVLDGTTLRATVEDHAGRWNVEFDTLDEDGTCRSATQRPVDHGKAGGLDAPLCEHVAATLYAFAEEPQSFTPPNLAGLVKVLQKNPNLRSQVSLPDAQVQKAAQMLSAAPPEVLALLERLALDSSPAAAEQLTDRFAALAAAESESELKSLLEDLSMGELGEMARRRGWSIKSKSKSELVPYLVSQLRAFPAPENFSPEEEQLLRLENTLYGLADLPTQNELVILWKKRAGGDMARLDRALQGLQNAGVLIRCMRESGQPHFHWSPFLDSTQLPLKAPKVALYAASQVGELETSLASLPFLSWVDAALEVMRRSPLQLRPVIYDEELAKLSYVGAWEVDPAEIARLKQPRSVPTLAVEGITIPLALPYTDETLDVLGGSLQWSADPRESCDFAAWLAGSLASYGLAQKDETGKLQPSPARIEEYRLQPSEMQYRRHWEIWLDGGLGELRTAVPRAGLVLKRALQEPDLNPLVLKEEMGQARQFVARLLRGLEPLVWYDWASFAKVVHEQRPDFLHLQTEAHTWWFASDGGTFKISVQNPRHWDLAFRAILKAIFQGALNWLGVVELGNRDGELAAFRITSPGAWLLSGGQVGSISGAAPAAETGGELITWLDAETFRVRATPEAAPLLAAARSIATSTRELLTFQVSNVAIAHAFERGLLPGDLIKQFADADTQLPSDVCERLEALHANYGRLQLYEELTVLELADDFALRELLASTTLRRHIVHQFSPRVVAVKDEAVDALVSELVKKGYTPRVLDEAASP